MEQQTHIYTVQSIRSQCSMFVLKISNGFESDIVQWNIVYTCECDKKKKQQKQKREGERWYMQDLKPICLFVQWNCYRSCVPVIVMLF